jgi:ABC-type oligopeptide transport system substrate-binding subunit/class 3 adenylate cyclase
MQCPKCNTENREGAKFCVNCGAKLVLACAQCGTELLASAKFCDTCGAQVIARPAEVREEPAAAPTMAAEALKRLVPKEYAERLLATRGQVQAERRMVTILFSDVKGSTAMAEDLDPEDVMEIMDGAFDVLIEPIYRYEGTLARLMGDAVLAFFGAPIAHEDDPERAIRAALDITAGAREYAAKLEQESGITSFNVRVGINTGLVVVGEVGSDLRVEYTAMGDAINLAARMEQSAPPGGILITHDTYRHVRGVFDVLRQEPLTVKGRRQPVQAYLVQRAKARPFRKPMRGVEGIETRMIGRQAELNRLQEAFHTAVEYRELQMATIVGEAGVGKSRLLHEFDLWSDLVPEPFYFFKGRALQEMQSQPYSLMRDLFAFRFQIEDTDPLPVVRERLEQGTSAALGAGQESQMRAHIIGHLLGFELGPSPHLEGVLDDPKQIRERGLTYLVDYFKALASQDPVLILLEDLHWADDSSLDVLNHLALALTDQPLMIGCTARPALFERRPHWGEGQTFHRRLLLEPLTKRNTRRLLDEILQRVDQVPDTLSDLVVAGAEGNPFFVEELVKMLVEDGVIIKGEDQWRVEPSRLTEVRVPPTLRGVLQARLDRLPLQERTVLQQAAVVGRLFWDRAVVSIHEAAADGGEEAEVVDSLSALRGREMVFQRETTAIAGAEEYIFKHALLREVTYKSLLKRLRRIYHGLVADWLMEQAGERVGEYTGLIADHLELAGRVEEAAEWLIRAGDRARGLYAHQEAIGAYRRALALLEEQGDLERAARTLMKLGLTHHTAFQFKEAHHAYDEGFTVWQRASAEAPALSLPRAPHALRSATHSDIATLDPGLAWETGSSDLLRELFAGLVQLTPELDVVPDVAASWAVLEGGHVYVFHIREDAYWSNGTRVTAHDFEYAWRRVLDPATGSPNAGLLYDIKGARAFHQGEVSDPDTLGVRATDDLTLRVDLEGPTGYFLQLLAHTHTQPVPRHAVEALGEAWAEPANLVTNGPFRLQTWVDGESMVMVRHPQYHGVSTGNVERVELRLLSDWSGSQATYDGDGLDILPLCHLAQSARVRAKERHAGEHIQVPSLTTTFVVFNPRKPPFDDLRLRLAFALAVDRETFADVVLAGLHSPATGGFVPPGMPGHSPQIALPYEPERARQLLAEAGYPGGRGFPNVWAPLPSTQRSLGEYLQTQWRETLGVEIPYDIMVWPEYARTEWEKVHFLVSGWVADYPDPDNFLRVYAALGPYVRNEAYDRLVEKARRLMDQEERMKLYRQADRMLIEGATVVPLTYDRWHVLLKPWVTRYPTSPIRRTFWKDVIIEPHW